jgi:hypothetical protein
MRPQNQTWTPASVRTQLLPIRSSRRIRTGHPDAREAPPRWL